MISSDASLGLQQAQAAFTDFNDLNRIRQDGHKDEGAALDKIAKQFESMLLHTMLKTMRDTNEVFSEDSFFNSSEMKFHQEMFDHQLALTLSNGKGLGLSEALARQLRQQFTPAANAEGIDKTQLHQTGGSIEQGESAMPLHPLSTGYALTESTRLHDVSTLKQPFTATTQASDRQRDIRHSALAAAADITDSASASTETAEALYELFLRSSPQPAEGRPIVNPAASAADSNGDLPVNARYTSRRAMASAYSGKKQAMASTPEEFVQQVKPYAERAAASLGVDANLLIAQAALETGWGRHVIHKTNGSSSNNLFNIKAGGNWQDERVAVSTLEYRDGVAHQEKAAFRVYDGLQDSFNDYARLIRDNERYQKARDNAASPRQYLHEIQAAGYATDPHYAEKVWRVFQSSALQDSAPTTNRAQASQDRLTPLASSYVNSGRKG